MTTEPENTGSTPTPMQPQAAPVQTTHAIIKPVVQPVAITDWIITFFLLAIPILNIILLIIWAFSSDTNPSKANFAKAYLIIMLIFIGLTILFVMLFGATLWTLIQSQGGGYF